jgi:D-serine deaminase-like pyridoxal phosphate-dependent protein
MSEQHVDSLASPALVVDAARFEANVAAAGSLFAETSTRLRPHVKTHRCSGLALRQLGGPARGVTCATVGEAEAMVAAGIDDVLVANEVIDPDKLDRLAALARTATLAVAVDSTEGAALLSDAARRAGVTVDVLVDVDVGLHRCGVAPPREAAALARSVEDAEGLRFAGLMGYEGRIRASDPDRSDRLGLVATTLAEATAVLREEGFTIETVSSAGTSTLLDALEDPVVTEIQAGTYALMEHDLDDLDLPFEPAMTVHAGVISTAPGRVVLGAGRKSIDCDYGPPRCPDPRGTVTAIHEEHTVLDWEGATPPLGSRIALLPLNVRLTCNLHDALWLVRDGRVEERLAIDARGRSQ